MNPSILLDHEPTPNPGQHVVRALLRIDGTPPDGARRVPLNLSLVLDRSGSMTHRKLDAAKQAATLLLSRLWPDDVASVVAYDNEAITVAEPAPRSAHTGLGANVAAIGPGGCTNLSAGWLLGRRHVEAHRAAERSNRILLLTDGLANVGITAPDRLASLLRASRDEGVTTTTIGFGTDFDERLLRMMADAGGGNTYYIEEPDQAPAVFEAEIGELLGLSAQNLSVEIRLEGGSRLGAIHHSYPRETTDFGVRLRLGDLYASEPKLLLLEAVAEEGSHPDRSVHLATLTVSGDVVSSDGGIEHRRVTLPIRFSPAEGAVVHPEVRRELLFLHAAAAREAALAEEARGNAPGGAQTLREAAYMVRNMGATDDPRVKEEAGDLEAMADRLSTAGYDAADRKYLRQRSFDTTRSKGSSWRRTSRSRQPEAEKEEE